MNMIYLNEVIELHRFFEEWFNGIIEPSDDNFSRLDEVLGEGFFLISPDGRLNDRDSVIAGLRQLHGSRRQDAPPFRIWIEDIQVHPISTDLALVTYQEWQEVKGKTTTRLSSALFQENEEGPNKVEWLYVHETWMAK